MSIEQCENKECRHFYELFEFGSERPAPPATKTISCPYCGHTIKRTSRGAFVTTPHDTGKTTLKQSDDTQAIPKN